MRSLRRPGRLVTWPARLLVGACTALICGASVMAQEPAPRSGRVAELATAGIPPGTQ